MKDMRSIMMLKVVKFVVIDFLLIFSYQSLFAQYEKIDLSNNNYDTAVFRKVLPPDAIKSILKPEFKILSEALDDTSFYGYNNDDWIFIVEYSGIAKLYPIMPLIWHEAVNDHIDDFEFTVTYCVLTGSAMVFDRNINENSKKTFGVSGCLYNSNLVMYDYQTRSTWPQLAAKSYSGSDEGQNLSMLKFKMAKYSFVKENYPNGLLLIGDSRMPNFKRMYKEYPFKGLDTYSANDSLRFPTLYKPDGTFSSKDLFLYFPKKGIAVHIDELKGLKQDYLNVIISNDEIVSIEPKNGNIFISLYYFALKTFYPKAKLLKQR